MITLLETGLVDYTDLGLVKPVKFTEEDLRMIASSTSSVNLTEEHTDNVLSSLSNFIVSDGCLKTSKPKDLDFKGKGFSPEISCDELIDMGDFYRMKGFHMTSVGVASKPRNRILYNSINPNGGKNMSNDEDFRKLVADNRSLTEEVGSLKNQLTSMTKKFDDKKKELEDLKKSQKDSDDKLVELEALQKKADAYDSLVEKQRESLIKDVTGGDESKIEKYKSFTNEQLQVILDERKTSRQKRGVDPKGNHMQDGNEPNPEDDDDVYDWDAFEAECEAFGL